MKELFSSVLESIRDIVLTMTSQLASLFRRK
jgi:hypothetical protein